MFDSETRWHYGLWVALWFMAFFFFFFGVLYIHLSTKPVRGAPGCTPSCLSLLRRHRAACPPKDVFSPSLTRGAFNHHFGSPARGQEAGGCPARGRPGAIRYLPALLFLSSHPRPARKVTAPSGWNGCLTPPMDASRLQRACAPAGHPNASAASPLNRP